MSQEGQIITRALYEENLISKMQQESFNKDIMPLITSEHAKKYDSQKVSLQLMKEVICHLKGESWKGEQ